MKNLTFLSILLTGVFVISFSDFSFAQGCVVTGATPDGGEVVNCNGVDNDGIETTNQADEITVEINADITSPDDNAIDTLEGDDFVLIKGGRITAQSGTRDALRMGAGNNEIIIEDGTLIGQGEGITTGGDSSTKLTMEKGHVEGITDEGIFLSNGSDEVYIMGGTVLGTSAALQTNQGDDTIIITGGFLKHSDEFPDDLDPTIKTGDGNDLIAVSHATVDGTMAVLGAIQGEDDDDTVRLGTRAVVTGIIYGNSFRDGMIQDEGFDTLVFEMGVRPEFIDSTCELILSKDPQIGSVIVNGLLYEWRDFDVILCEIVPAQPKAIPTLSEWGMIAMAGVIGIAGVLFVVRRRVTT